MKHTQSFVFLAALPFAHLHAFSHAPLQTSASKTPRMARSKLAGPRREMLRSQQHHTSPAIKESGRVGEGTDLSLSPPLASLFAAAILGPFSLTFVPYVACLKWGLPSTKIGSWKSKVSMGHRFGGIATLVLPLFLAGWEAATQSHAPVLLYGLSVAMALANLGFGAMLITRKVPAYDIPTLRAFAVGVLLGTAFLGSSLLFIAGPSRFYEPVGAVFAAVAVYAAVFSVSDAFQHARLFLRSKLAAPLTSGGIDGRDDISLTTIEPMAKLQAVRGGSSSSPSSSSSSSSTATGLRLRHWYLPFERANLKDIFVRNLWRQPTAEALEASVSPPNGVVVFTTSMTAAFALLALLQLRYLALGSGGMAAFAAAEPAFCRWSAYQALLAVVANNFGTFAGTLVIQRRASQKQAGLYNAIGLLIPVLNIAAFLAMHPGHAGRFTQLLFLKAAAAM